MNGDLCPHWSSNVVTHAVTSSPALYVSGSKVQAVAQFKASGWGGSSLIEVKGDGPGFTLFGTNYPPGSGATNWEVTVLADTPLTYNLVQFFNPMTHTFYSSHREGSPCRLNEHHGVGLVMQLLQQTL